MVTKILDHLYLGDFVDALTWKNTIICVMQDIQPKEPMKAYWIPIIRTSKPHNDDHMIDGQDLNVTALQKNMMLVAETIMHHEESGEPVLVHCMAGIERSPLAVVWYLHYFKDMTWDDAYDFVKEKRPEVANRMQWLDLTYKERTS